MKVIFVAALLLVGGLTVARAQSDADSKYIGIYGLIQKADQLAENGDPGEALAVFTDAQTNLEQFQKQYPTWNPTIVSFRLDQLRRVIAGLKERASLSVAGAAKSVPAAAPSSEVITNGQSTTAAMDEMRTRLQVAQVANELLQVKLREALATQPAAVDPRELARAQEKIRWLMKENDLLKVSRSGANPIPVPPQIVTNFTRVYVTNQPPAVTNYATVTVIVTNQTTRVVTNITEIRVVDTNAPVFVALQAENVRLKGDLARSQAASVAPAVAEKDALELKQSRTRIAVLESEVAVAALEKITLQNKLQQALAGTNSSLKAADYEARLRELTLERNALIERLDLAVKQKSGKNSEAQSQLAKLNSEAAVLRARLAAAEAQPVPFSAEELALFKRATPAPATLDVAKKSIKEMPADTMELITSAQQHFARREYDQAEADYQKILNRDQNNGIALANLATIEMQQGKLALAEQHIQAALAQSPDDAFNLATLGYLKFRQEKYAEALDSLSRSAQLNPNNPEVQSYLGVALSHEGQRRPAEAALRRALQLAPNYAPAHNNLAVIYLSQQPPLVELARWHYQKALAGGQARNPDLEKLLAEKGAPVAP